MRTPRPLGRLLIALHRPAEDGQTLVEYGILVMLLAIASIAILGILGQDVVGLFTSVSNGFQNATSP